MTVRFSGSSLDTLARRPLWQYGLDFGHGTGHGIGMFLNVHEGKALIFYLTWLFYNLFHRRLGTCLQHSMLLPTCTFSVVIIM